MNNTLAIVGKAGNLTIAEEEVLRSRVEDMEEALEKEQANDRAIEDKIKVGATMPVYYSICSREMFISHRVSVTAVSARETCCFFSSMHRVAPFQHLDCSAVKEGQWFLVAHTPLQRKSPLLDRATRISSAHSVGHLRSTHADRLLTMFMLVAAYGSQIGD